MALTHESEAPYTKWMHMENGKVMVRRLHRLEIQSSSGQMFVLTGDKLPEAFVTSAGQGHKGAHVGQILLRPKRLARSLVWTGSEVDVKTDTRWPTCRDAINWMIGIAFVVFWNFWVNTTHYM